MANNLYNEKSIESLSPLEFTRLRPGVYAGDTTYSTQLLVEILSNAIDEFRLGHGDKIEVAINGDTVSVRDYGQGFIVNSVREDGKTILEAAFSVLNTSGKYREDGTYEGTSLGSFGIGSKITTFLSHWLTVATVRDGMSETDKEIIKIMLIPCKIIIIAYTFPVYAFRSYSLTTYSIKSLNSQLN